MSLEKNENVELKANYLSFVEIIAQSIGSIAPTASLAFVIPLVYATAGNGTWLVYLFALIATLLVTFNLNKFTSRSASPGSLYTYIVLGLGPSIGFISGWALLLGYGLTASAVLSGFISFSNEVLGYIDVHIPLVILGIVGAISTWYVAYRDIKLSAKLTLLFEGLSVGIISILGLIVLIHNGFTVDWAQFTLEEVSPNSIRTGLVIAFFSFVGFESAASLGAEAKEPLKIIPKTLIVSTILVGIFFVAFSYIEIIGYLGSTTKLNEAAAPLSTLAQLHSVGFLAPVLAIGTVFSFWASVLACTNAGARILLTMGRHDILQSALGNIHKKNQTPHVSILTFVVIFSIIPVILIGLDFGIADIYGWLGTLATFGLIFNYLLITIATPVYLKKNNLLQKRDTALAAITAIILLIPLVGSVYPIQDYPYNLFPLLFIAWLFVGIVWFQFKKGRHPELVGNINGEIDKISEKFREAM